jgi:hypothetical protein
LPHLLKYPSTTAIFESSQVVYLSSFGRKVKIILSLPVFSSVVLPVRKWSCINHPSVHPSVKFKSDRFFSRLRVRNSKFLGLSHPSIVIENPARSLPYSCCWRNLSNYLRIKFYCYRGFWIFYYAFILWLEDKIILIKLVFIQAHLLYIINNYIEYLS